MLSEKEKEGFQQMLSQLSGDELLSLKDTVTRTMVTAQSKTEAISAIVNYSESAVQLLRRKKLKHKYIFQYLVSNNIHVLPTADKPCLIRKVMEHWGTQVQLLRDVDLKEEPGDLDMHQEHRAPTDGRVSPVNVMQSMAEQFSTWFYQMLNSYNPILGQQPSSSWGPQHFYHNVKLKIFIERGLEEFEGDTLVAQRLLAFPKDECLLFNPNIGPNGVKGMENAHGLVLVCVCGTVHRGNNCLGVFEQTFGLIKDPGLQNNWKIKHINLKMQITAVAQTPVLDDTPETLAIMAQPGNTLSLR
ncbi:uncharacterized protein C3orf38-like [Saccoglossus kowalevskii]|uniref:Uncharacterized protein C3orf38 homolog n=1 Tax=Saccoglossus kowalevskii TaxID=10224 RepID=A0ABM0GNI5_SACKO|nr:PREDICTED: uncharacterized protein C3orf38 homolog [Saccoglossus kowalevskii]